MPAPAFVKLPVPLSDPTVRRPASAVSVRRSPPSVTSPEPIARSFVPSAAPAKAMSPFQTWAGGPPASAIAAPDTLASDAGPVNDNVPLPSAAALPMARPPPATLTPPVNELLVEIVSTPAPDFAIPVEPAIVPVPVNVVAPVPPTVTALGSTVPSIVAVLVAAAPANVTLSPA